MCFLTPIPHMYSCFNCYNSDNLLESAEEAYEKIIINASGNNLEFNRINNITITAN